MNKQISTRRDHRAAAARLADRRHDVLAGVGGAGSLAAKQDNAIQRVAQFRDQARPDPRVRRQDRASPRTRKQKVAGQTLYFRRYRPGGLAAQVVGYSTQGRSRAGLERSENAYLTASNANLGTIFDKLGDSLKGTTITGQQPRPEHPGRARSGSPSRCCAGKCGAAVVLNPKTGAVYVMASSPTLQPEQDRVEHRLRADPPLAVARARARRRRCSTARRRASTRRARRSRRSPPRPRSTPGSTRRTRRSSTRATAPSTARRSRTRSTPTRTAPRPYGHVDLLEAYQHSINAVFCNIGKKLGAEPDPRQGEGVRLLLEAADRAAVGRGRAERPLQLRRRTRCYDNPALVDPGRLAFGQEHMLDDAAADGARRRRRREQRHDDGAAPGQGGAHAGRRLGRQGHSRRSGSTAMKPQTAADAEPDDAGRRHRRHRPPPRRSPASRSPARRAPPRPASTDVYDAWFIFFAPADNPTVAGAVVVEHQLNGFGGSVAAPIAKQLMQAILPAASKRISRTRMSNHDTTHRPHLRQALRDQAQARLGRDGRRLPRRGPGAGPPRRAEAARTSGTPPTSSSSSGSAARRRAPPA